MDDNRDRLSDLPLEIIQHILLRNPITDVIRTTSGLSRMWRYMWTTLPWLHFKEGKSTEIHQQWLKMAITFTLLGHQGPVDAFLLDVSTMRNCCHTDAWLIKLSKAEIKGLWIALKKTLDSSFLLHSSLYSCQKLTRLTLAYCELPTPPSTFNGFPSLRRFFVSGVKDPSAAVERIAANSPLLESFKFLHPTDLDAPSLEFKHSSPNITEFELRGSFKEISLDAPVVASVRVQLNEDHFTAEQLQLNSSVCNYTKFLGGLTHLDSLIGEGYFTKYLSVGIDSYDRSLRLHQLEFIYVSNVNFQDVKQRSVIVHLIMGVPTLQVLGITASSIMAEDEAPPIPFTYLGYSPDSKFDKLRDILLIDVRDLEFIKFLLKGSPLLEQMTVERDLPTKGLSELRTKLLSYNRASPNAKILVKNF